MHFHNKQWWLKTPISGRFSETLGHERVLVFRTTCVHTGFGKIHRRRERPLGLRGRSGAEPPDTHSPPSPPEIYGAMLRVQLTLWAMAR